MWQRCMVTFITGCKHNVRIGTEMIQLRTRHETRVFVVIDEPVLVLL